MLSLQSSFQNRGLGSNASLDESLPTLREGKSCHQEDKENMTAGDAQQFWSTLSIHAASTVMGIGGKNESALAAAESVLEHGEKSTRGGTPITTQAVRNAASKSSIAVLKCDGEDSRVASAVAVAVIQKGTALLHEMNGKQVDQTQSLENILTEKRSAHDNSVRTSSQRSRKSASSSRGSSSRGRKKNTMINDMKKLRGSESQENRLDDNITVGSISTFEFKQWDKYATEKESPSERNRKPISIRNSTSTVKSSMADKYKILDEWTNAEPSQASALASQYSTDQSTIATESYHLLGKRSSRRKKEEDLLIPKFFSTTGGSLSSYNITKKVDSLAVLGAGSSDISSMRRKEEELERKHAEFSAAAEALEKKIALAVAALEESGASATPKLDSTNLQTPRVSNRGGASKTPWMLNHGGASTKADTSLQELTITTNANDINIDDDLTASTGKQSRGGSVSGSASKLARIAEDTTEHAKDDIAGNSDNRLPNRPKTTDVVSDQKGGDEEKDEEEEEEIIEDEEDGKESIEVYLGKKSLKDKVKGFFRKKKRVTWAATNAFKTIPARSDSGLSRATRTWRRKGRGLKRRGSKRRGSKRRGLKQRFSRSRSTEESSVGESHEQEPDVSAQAPSAMKDVEVRVVTFNDEALTTEAEAEILPNENFSLFSRSGFSGPESQSEASSKSAPKNFTSPISLANPITRFLDQAFYFQPEHSIDEETAATFSTNNSSEAQSSVEAILEAADDISRVTGDTSNYSSSWKSGSGSNLGLRFA